MIAEAIILAGGLGTRLRSAVPDLPKCMAPLNGIPFIHFVLAHLRRQGVTHFIFSLGYKHEVLTDYLDRSFPGLDKTYVVENEPLGTGGAIKASCKKLRSEHAVIVNGDSLFNIDFAGLCAMHVDKSADCSLALKQMFRFDRYGVVQLDATGRVTAFEEKGYRENGLINGGVYALNALNFLQESLPEKFSFEKDYLEKLLPARMFYGQVQDAYFIDIGIPEDYERAERELGTGN